MAKVAYDIDGVVSLGTGPFKKRRVNPKVERQIKRDKAAGKQVHYITNRPRHTETITREWLEEQGLPVDGLMMPSGPDQVQNKQRNLDKLNPEVMWENDSRIINGVEGHNVRDVDEIKKSLVRKSRILLSLR